MEKPIHSEALKPEALKKYRKDRGLTQMELAEKCGCSTETISRWERGKTGNVRSHSRKKLTKALGVEWEQLTRAPVDEDESRPFSKKVVLNVRIGGDVRNALTLVGLRYGLNVADVIELAPLLFLVIAEKSLVHRREKLQEILKRCGPEDDQDAAPHLRTDLFRSSTAEDALHSEEGSISKRDIFGKHIQLGNHPDEDDDLNPLLNYLRGFIEGIPDDPVTVWNSYYGIDFSISEEMLRDVTGIDGEDETEEKIFTFIWHGDIDLREFLSQKKNLSPGDYQDWLQKQVADVESEHQKWFDSMGLTI